MEKLRPFVAAILGLTLWVQGLAVAAAPGAMAAQAADTSMEMPCHGDGPAPSVSPCDCCDGDCANMTGCVVGSFVGAATVLAPVAPPAHAAIAARTWSAKTAVSPLPLRPPITSHA
jgi:hypothetical protein